jgi:hypothetical protein
LDSFEEINSRFVEFIDLVRKGTAPVSDKDQVIKYSRRALTGELVKIFAKVVSGQSS